MRHQRFLDASDIISPARTSAVVPAPGGFVACPLPIGMGLQDRAGWASELYRLAYEQARVALSPPWHVRNLFASLN